MLRVLLIVVLVIATTNAFAFDPPKGLKWGMTYDEVKAKLENPDAGDKVKVKKLSKNHKTRTFFPEHNLSEGYKSAQLEKIKLLDNKVKTAYAVFDTKGKFTVLQYQFDNITGEDTGDINKMWVYYQKLTDALKKKYGEPTRNQVTPIDFGIDIPKDTYLETAWVDEKGGDEIRVYVAHFKIGGGLLSLRLHYVILKYASKNWLENELDKVLEEDL
jgi:hypothetical protein